MQLAFQPRGSVRAPLSLPQVSTLRRGIPSSSGCRDTDARSPKPSRRIRGSGIRTRVPGVGSRPLEEAGISLGMHGEDWRMSCQGGPGYILLWGGAAEEPEFLLAEEAHEGGSVRGRSARGGRRDEALEEADWEMSAGGGSRERDCAGRAVAAERGYGVGFSGGLAGRQMAACERRSRSWPSARRGCCDSSSSGKLLSARREGNRPVTSGTGES